MPESDTTADAVVIERTFAAPADLVWEMWTEPEHFGAWYGPDGARLPVVDLDVRVGGRRRVCMEVDTPDGVMRMWFTGEHREVVVNQRLVYTEAIADDQGLAPAPDAQTTEVRVELEAAPGGTRVVLTHTGVPAGSPGEAGWMMALDKLARNLSQPITS